MQRINWLLEKTCTQDEPFSNNEELPLCYQMKGSQRFGLLRNLILNGVRGVSQLLLDDTHSRKSSSNSSLCYSAWDLHATGRQFLEFRVGIRKQNMTPLPSSVEHWTKLVEEREEGMEEW
ncbi:hypothetical protein E2C01_049866 [Portunus trituberculatus]|uniref:Uncharacterized protein n=1 Tax=Portunus trituberculatus TaxID=210409 RepID=A0A5B7G7I5_PORTR|nr:hypothetical protein [Portunus trituberculatus]